MRPPFPLLALSFFAAAAFLVLVIIAAATPDRPDLIEMTAPVIVQPDVEPDDITDDAYDTIVEQASVLRNRVRLLELQNAQFEAMIAQLIAENEDLQQRLDNCLSDDEYQWPRLALFSGSLTPQAHAYAESIGVPTIPIAYHWQFDWDGGAPDGTIEEARWRGQIEELIPDPDYVGPVCLDCERIYTDVMQSGPDDPRWEHVLGQMVRLKAILIELRPGAEGLISYWGWPMVPAQAYVGDDDPNTSPKPWVMLPDDHPEWQRQIDLWRKSYAILKPDWFTPGFYDGRVDDEDDWHSRKLQPSQALARTRVIEAIAPDAPLLPSICHRVCGGHIVQHPLLTPAEIWRDQLQHAAAHDGAVWWWSNWLPYKDGTIPGVPTGMTRQEWYDWSTPLQIEYIDAIRLMMETN